MKVGIFGNRYQKKDQVSKIVDVLSGNHAQVYIQHSFYDYIKSDFNLDCTKFSVLDDEKCDIDIALSIGGDGTFLKTASLVEKNNIPVLGINTGHLGFLADISENDLEIVLTEILEGKYRLEERSQLSLSTVNGYFSGSRTALNEVAVLKQDTASMLIIRAYINGEYLNSYQADGILVCTPTGSTAYSMSVGGPIMAPDCSNFIISAIAPHSLTARPLVIEDSSIITLEIESRNRSFLVSLDGRSDVFYEGTSLKITKAERSLKVIKRIGHTFYETLREKLMWGADTRLGGNG